MFKKLFFCLIVCAGLICCSQKSEYDKMLERERNSEVRHDSLFLGYEFGMNVQEF
jgi:hypothetical protein